MTCIPPAISGVVDADDGGAVRLRTDTTPPAAVLVVSDTKFAAWKSMFPAGLNKAVESKYNKTHRLWFVMTGIPADAPTDSRIINTTEEVSVFWSGFRVPIDAGEWQLDPPETLPEVSYADIMRLCGFGEAAISPAPEPAPFDGTAIPQEMKKRNQWLCWKFGERDGKPTKIPINPETYGFAKAPEANWSYETCRKAMAAGYRGFVGIGFSLRNGIIGVDFDHVLDERGQLISEYAHLESIVDKIKSYTEMSPSGTGFHIYFKCDSIPPACKAGRKRKGNVEMYCEGRFFTVTGRAWRNPGVLRTLSGDEYREIHTLLFGSPAPTHPSMTTEVSLNTAAGPAPEALPTMIPSRSDDEVYYRVIGIPMYKALWEGNTTRYPSPSEADYALMCKLAEVTGCNKEQMLRLFRQSKLSEREKATARPDYLERTADNAIRDVLQSQQSKTTAPTAGKPFSGGGGNNWQTEAAHQTCKTHAGKMKDIKRAGEGIYAVVDPINNIVTLVSSGRDDAFNRWCNKHFEGYGHDPKYAEEMFRCI